MSPSDPPVIQRINTISQTKVSEQGSQGGQGAQMAPDQVIVKKKKKKTFGAYGTNQVVKVKQKTIGTKSSLNGVSMAYNVKTKEKKIKSKKKKFVISKIGKGTSLAGQESKADLKAKDE